MTDNVSRLAALLREGMLAEFREALQAEEANSPVARNRPEYLAARLDAAGVTVPGEGLRAAGDGYEVRTWVEHQPSGVVVLPGHPQLGGRYCQTDGGDWPCAAVRAALNALAAKLEASDD